MSLHRFTAWAISAKFPEFVRGTLSGADGQPSGQRVAAFVGLCTAIGTTIHGLVTGDMSHETALGMWLGFTAAALGFAVFGAMKYWQAQVPPPDPHNPPTPQP